MPKLSYLAKLPTRQTHMVQPHVIELIISVNNTIDIGTIYVLSDINKFKWNKRFVYTAKATDTTDREPSDSMNS